MTFIERRKHERHECELAVHVRFSGQDEILEATIADICLGGCYVRTVSPPSAGTDVLLCFHEDGAPPFIPGRTINSMPGNGMGIEFAETIEQESIAWLRALIDRLDNGKQKIAAFAD